MIFYCQEYLILHIIKKIDGYKNQNLCLSGRNEYRSIFG